MSEGWELDQPVAPGGSTTQNIGEYAVTVARTKDGRKIIYQRKFDWGRNMNILTPATTYDTIKKIFDYVQQQDNFTLTLKAAVDAH